MDRCEKLSANDRSILNSIFNPNLPLSDVPAEVPVEESDTGEEESEALQEAKRLELEGVRAAESGALDVALERFTEAVKKAPEHASAYNNRAQALRLKNDTEGALKDLDKALELSGGKGRSACQAYTQRGLIRRLEGEEDAALEDFKAAAALGGEFAKSVVVQLNPYAALCNQMLSEVFEKVRRGEQ